MTVRKLPSGKWLCECYPSGRDGRRVRKQFATKHEATAYEDYIMQQVDDKPWLGEKPDDRRLSDLINTWYLAHGKTLESGERKRDDMLFFCNAIDNPLAVQFSAKDFSRYRELRLKGEIYRTSLVQAVTPQTLNNELTNLRAVFNELIRLDEWALDNPLRTVRKYKVQESEMTFLDKEQIALLISECEKSPKPELTTIVKICLSTGARWSEAENLTRLQITPYRITYTKTKSRRNRSIPISKKLYELIESTGPRTGKIFPVCYTAFRKAMERSGIELPKGQLSHVLRHTFASHFMINGGNILTLQKILGHKDIKTTMVYAHLAPDHLNEAITLNPLA